MIEEVPEVIQEVFAEKVQNKNGERQNNSRSPPPRYSVCNAAPTFAVTVIDADLDVCPIDIEGKGFCRAMFCLLAVLIYLYVSLTTGMEFGPTSDQIMRQRQSISTCDSAMSQASKLCT